jgi:hypothetical protein
METSKILCSVLAAATLVWAAECASANLIINGGFESGDFTGWTHSDISNDGVDGPSAHSGSFGAFLGQDGSRPASLSQSFATTAGASYNLGFWLANESSGECPNCSVVRVNPPPVSFEVYWNGSLIYSLVNPIAFSYMQISKLGLLATGGTSTLEFVYRNDPSFFDLDDISVDLASAVQVPDNFSTLWLALPLAGAMSLGKSRRRLPGM